MQRRISIRKLAGLGLFLALVFAGIYVGRSQLFGSPFPAERTFQFTYRASLDEIPAHVHDLRIWIPLAKTAEGQRLRRRTIRASVPYEVHQEEVFANEMLYARLDPSVTSEVHFEIDYEAQVNGDGFESTAMPDQLPLFLRSTQLMKITPEIQDRAEQTVEGKGSLWDKARAIYDYVIGHMVYDKTTPGWGRGDSVRACLLGKGNCTDFHSLFISMAQASEIPARFKIGFAIPREKEGWVPGYHCWAEFYDDKKGWVPVDASEAWKRPQWKAHYFGRYDTNKFFFSLGRDLVLNPRQKGDPVNIFIYPYVEGDGQPLPDGLRTEFYFRSL